MQLVGIDIGTTSICAVALSAQDGSLIQKRTVNSDAFLTSNKPFERIQDTEKIISLALSLLDEILTPDTLAIGVTGQMHGIVYLDENGNSQSPLYTWQDTRADEPYGDSTYALTLGICAGYGHASDFYNRINGIRPSSATTYATIHDYLVMRLTGRKAPLIHTTDAASFGLFSFETLSWDYDYRAEVTADFTVAGYYRGIPVSVAIGDNQASVLSTLTSEDTLLLNVGTGSQISLITDTPLSGENVENRPYFEGKYLAVGAALCGGRAYSLLKDFYHSIISHFSSVSEDEVYAVMDTLLQKKSETALKVDTRFAGTRNDSTVKGGVTGLTDATFTPEDLTRGVLSGMVEELYSMYREMDREKTSAVASGNGIRKNPHLLSIAKERFGMDIKIPAHLEEAAYGAALFGGIASGYFADMKSAQEHIRFL